jgi:hypothetical protein
MASQHSTEIDTPLKLKDRVEQILKAVEIVLSTTRHVYEARGEGKINSTTKKLTMKDGSEVGIDDAKEQARSLKELIRRIPRIVADQRTAERNAEKAKRGQPKAQPPIQYGDALVKFFKSADLGKFEGKKLQEHPKMKLFFESSVGNLIFGVSLFNVWGNIQKIKNGGTKIVLDDGARKALHLALDELKKTRRAQASNAELTEEKRAAAAADLAALEAGEIQNKDYMGILSYYNAIRINDDDSEMDKMDKLSRKEKLVGLTDAVTEMGKITHDLNKMYHDQIVESRPKVKAPAKEKKVVIKETAAVAAPAPKVPAAPKTAATTSAPAIPTVNARGTSPSERATKRK